MSDNSSLLPVSAPIAHFLEFFCLHGTPANAQTNPPVQIIVNHGYALGFCPDRGQPLWAAYQVAAAVRDVDFERPEFFYDDPRLPEAWRIGTQGYARVAGQTYDRGHMVPNFAINTQFGRVAQFETFLMSNIVPQRSPMNRGIWKNLEHGIVKSYAPMRKHVWVMCGPVFGA
ncbi:MAG: DNA/RNA endonuclease, partial [Acetobacteraceae bacterium]